ncbi:hypothetical protein [Campylobacter hominis]|uniref:hypothetical protein n=1 Tax=Campylobacter hominis TaxID=76517 RepID=UPI003899A28A
MKFLFLFLSPLILCADNNSNAEFFGVWTLLPPLVAIILAFITKDVIFSLLLGVLGLQGNYISLKFINHISQTNLT